MAAVRVNLVLACVLVLGFGGIAPWGMPGAAWATVAAQWFRVVAYVLLVTTPANRREFNTLAGMTWDGSLMRRLLRFGAPSGVQMLLDVGGFTVFVMLVGRLGKVEAEATTLAFSIGQLAFMPVWGFGIATSILVGQRLGEDRSDLATRAAWTSLRIALGYMGFISLLFVAMPQVFLSIFFSHGASTGPAAEQARDLTAVLLAFCAAYNLLDATLIIFVSVLKGAGDTRFVMAVSMVAALVLAGATWLAVVVAKLGIYWCWAIVTLWVWALGLTYLARFQQGAWRRMRVIEQTHHQGPGHEIGSPSVLPEDPGLTLSATTAVK
jgi:MATE family multidrug resistance protein